MSLNVVLNNNPGQTTAFYVDAIPKTLNAPLAAGKLPPGSSGVQVTAIKSQLVAGNPGGIGAAFGIGIAIDSGA